MPKADLHPRRDLHWMVVAPRSKGPVRANARRGRETETPQSAALGA